MENFRSSPASMPSIPCANGEMKDDMTECKSTIVENEKRRSIKKITPHTLSSWRGSSSVSNGNRVLQRPGIGCLLDFERTSMSIMQVSPFCNPRPTCIEHSTP